MLLNLGEKAKIFRYDVSDYSLSELYRKLPSCYFGYEKNKIKKYVQEKDQKRSLVGKIAVAKIIAKLLNVCEDELIFSRDSYDKPLLEKPFLKNLDFNVAHSGECVIVGVSGMGRIGVDVEKIKSINLGIAEDVFTSEEIKYMYLDEKIVLENFYYIWSLKESFVKAVGEGLSYPLKSFHFKLKNGNIIHEINSRKSEWKFKTYNTDHVYRIAACLEHGNFPDKIKIDNLE